MNDPSSPERLTPQWRLLLTDVEASALAPRERALRFDASLACKASLIVSAARNPDQPREWLPTNRTELRAWSDPGRGLLPWRGREVDARSGRNSELMDQIHIAWRLLAEADACQNAIPRKLGYHKKIELLLSENAALKKQIIEMMRKLNGRGAIADRERH